MGKTATSGATKAGRASNRMGRSLRFLTLLLLCAAIAACDPNKRLRKANVDQVLPGMAKKQVESILGVPNSVDTKDYETKQKTTFIYTQGTDKTTIVFWEDRVESKDTTLSN